MNRMIHLRSENIVGYYWYKYTLSKKSTYDYIPILVVETNLTGTGIDDNIHLDSGILYVKYFKDEIPTAYSVVPKDVIGPAGSIVLTWDRTWYTNQKGDNNFYFKNFNGGVAVYGLFDDGKEVSSSYLYSFNWSIDESRSFSYIPIIFHTKDDHYFLNATGYNDTGGAYKTNIPSTPNMVNKGAVPINDSFTVTVNNSCYITSINENYDKFCRQILKKADRKNPDDPYDGGDDKGDDDNTSGDYDHTSNPVPEPDLPSVSVTDSGLVTLFAPTESQLKALADYLWSDAFSLDNFKKMLSNPMDCILGLTIIPVNVPHGSAREITVGNIATTVSCDICPTQYVKVDCGTFTFNRHDMTNSYLDYSPYSKCYLYLPFIGVQEINIDDFMQSTMHIVYHVDILTGAMFCYVMRDNNVIYTYMGQCAENVPLSSSSYSNTIGSIMSAAASIVGVASVAATGGASAPVAAGLLAGASTSTANAVTSLKPSVAHSGSIGGGAGIMGVNYPYLIFNTPHVSIPSQQRHYTGYPSNQVAKLSALSGFNVIQAINLSVSGANDSEMNEIESMLKSGVIL